MPDPINARESAIASLEISFTACINIGHSPTLEKNVPALCLNLAKPKGNQDTEVGKPVKGIAGGRSLALTDLLT